MTIGGDLVRGRTSGGLGRAEEGLGRRHVAVLAQYDVYEIAVAVDGPIQIAPATAHFQVGFVHMPSAAVGSAFATAPLPKFAGQDRREFRLPFADGLVAEDDAAVEEHLAQVAQGQAVAQAPQHHERDDVRGILSSVQQAGAALIELLATVAAAKPTVALGGALRPL